MPIMLTGNHILERVLLNSYVHLQSGGYGAGPLKYGEKSNAIKAKNINDNKAVMNKNEGLLNTDTI